MDDFRWKDWQMETSLASCQLYADSHKLFAWISSIGHKDHKVTKSKGPRGSTAQVEAAQRNFQALKETLNILASVLPLFLNLFNCWSASAFSSACCWPESVPELRSQSNCLQCGDRSLWKRSYPCVFRWPQPQSISSCSLNDVFHEFHLLL